MAVPAENLIKIPEGVPFDQAAVVTDAVATPYHAITARGKLQLGETVAVIGCGGMGIHAVQLCMVGGASQVIAVDADDEILERTGKVGVTHMVNVKGGNAVKKIRALTGGEGVDLALEFVGHNDTIALGAKSLKNGGSLIVCGLGPDNITIFPPNVFVWREFQIMGSYS
jgi:D-arabinose 1-dehydrogenase-like Zn-dependent alcohol dehydrogenase